MTIDFFCPRWGSDHLDLDSFCRKVKDAGYDGVEHAITATMSRAEMEDIWSTLEKHQLKIIPQHYDTCSADFPAHFDAFHAWLEKLKPFSATKIDSQTGRDFFSFQQNKALIDAATAFTASTGIEVLHETHRNKALFAAHTTKEFLEQIPELTITLDASHWVCVAESYLEDQEEAVELAISRTGHIHARVGYPEGPQVPDPRIPEWQQALDAHLSWWDRVVAQKKKEGAAITITPEFGPHPYMVHLPGTGQPIADQWEVNKWIMELLRKRYC